MPDDRDFVVTGAAIEPASCAFAALAVFAAVASGVTLLETGDPHDLEVVADVLATDAARIGVAARVELLNSGGDGKLEVPLDNSDRRA